MPNSAPNRTATADLPYNQELLVIPPEASAGDPLAGGTIMPLPARAPVTEAAPEAVGAADVNWPFWMRPVPAEIPVEDMKRLRSAADTAGMPLETMMQSWHDQRRRLVDEVEHMQRRAAQLHAQIMERRRNAGRVEPLRKRERVNTGAEPAERGPPWYGITLATLLVPDAAERAASWVASFDHERAETVDGGRVRMRTNRVTVEKGSAQAVRLLVAEAKARGWSSIEACGTKEFCEQLRQAVAEEGGVRLTAWVRGPSRILNPRPIRYDPPEYSNQEPEPDHVEQVAKLQADARRARNAPPPPSEPEGTERKTPPRVFREPTGAAWQGEADMSGPSPG